MTEIAEIVEACTELTPEPPKRRVGRPRIHPVKIVDDDTPKKLRGRPRIRPIKEIDPNKPKQIRNRPALSKSIYNKRYVEKHPDLYQKYGKKKTKCELCNRELLSRNYKLHISNKLHLANLFKNLSIETVH